jgi:YbbR domain-containing protein
MRRIWPFRHFGLKLLSVALALLLWMVVSGEETVERGLRVPLEFQQFPQDLEFVGDVPIVADVRVRGAFGTLSRIAPGDIVAVLDLRGVHPGRRLFQLTQEQVRAPAGVEVIQVVPSTVQMLLERTMSRTVPVTPPVLQGVPAEGYMVGTITIDPTTVDVVGPESAVTAGAEATTEPLSVAGAHSRVREVVTVGTRDPALRLKTPRSATVTVEIVPSSERAIHVPGAKP